VIEVTPLKFRLLFLVNILMLLGSALAYPITVWNMSSEDLVAWNQLDSNQNFVFSLSANIPIELLSQFSFVLNIAPYIVFVIIAVGLLLLRKWARAALLIFVLISILFEISVRNSIASFEFISVFDTLICLTTGALLALAYCSTVSRKFK